MLPEILASSTREVRQIRLVYHSGYVVVQLDVNCRNDGNAHWFPYSVQSDDGSLYIVRFSSAEADQIRAEAEAMGMPLKIVGDNIRTF